MLGYFGVSIIHWTLTSDMDFRTLNMLMWSFCMRIHMGGTCFKVSSEGFRRVCTEFDSGEISGQVQSLAYNGYPFILQPCSVMPLLNFGFREWVFLLCYCATNSLISCFKLLLFCGHPLFVGQYLLYYHSPHTSVKKALKTSMEAGFLKKNGATGWASWTPVLECWGVSRRYFRWNWKTVPQSQHWQLMVMGPWAWE